MHDIMHRNLALCIPLHIQRVLQHLIKLIPQVLPFRISLLTTYTG